MTVEFRDDPGSWPKWSRGVASMYASEIALNHWAPDLDGPTELLDHQSSSPCSVNEYPHVHCWHGDDAYSKQQWRAGAYAEADQRKPGSAGDLAVLPGDGVAVGGALRSGVTGGGSESHWLFPAVSTRRTPEPHSFW